MEAGCAVYILNPGKPRMIGQSTKKTDKEDALKIAKFIQRYPKEELPLVSLSAGREEELRQLTAMKQFLVKTRKALVNRLRGGTLGMIAESIERELEAVEAEPAVFKEKIAEIVRESKPALYIMSIPGVGPALAAFTAYIGDGERFATAGQAANYAGLTPVLDCSGDTARYGHIQRGGCRALRSIILQPAWAVIRSSGDGRLKAKFQALSGRMSKTKSAAAIARRMIVLMWVLAKRRRMYADAATGEPAKKFRYYKLTR